MKCRLPFPYVLPEPQPGTRRASGGGSPDGWVDRTGQGGTELQHFGDVVPMAELREQDSLSGLFLMCIHIGNVNSWAGSLGSAAVWAGSLGSHQKMWHLLDKPLQKGQEGEPHKGLARYFSTEDD